jgi:hypothetical protein
MSSRMRVRAGARPENVPGPGVLLAIRDAESRAASWATTRCRTSSSSGRCRPCCARWRARSTSRRWGSSTPPRCGPFARSLADTYLVMERGEFVLRGRGADMERDGVKDRLAL